MGFSIILPNIALFLILALDTVLIFYNEVCIFLLSVLGIRFPFLPREISN